jgi:hypothetical protein
MEFRDAVRQVSLDTLNKYGRGGPPAKSQASRLICSFIFFPNRAGLAYTRFRS